MKQKQEIDQSKKKERQALLQIENLSINVMGSSQIKNWSFTIRAGDIIAVIGRNGSGKTTLLKTMAGLIKCHDGTISKKPETKIAYMPQVAELSTSVPIKVEDFIGLWTSEENEEYMESLGINQLIGKSMESLSGGEIQKVLFYSIIQSGANLILLDEPENHLDDQSVDTVMRIVLGSKNKAFVVVSHEHQKIIQASNHILQVGQSIMCKQHINCKNEE